MSRGFLVGLLWGLVVSVAALVVVSLVAPRQPAAVASAPEAPAAEAASETEAELAAESSAEPDVETETELAAAPSAEAAQPAIGTVDLSEGQSAASEPTAETPAAEATAPAAGPEAAEVTNEPTEPAATEPAATEPAATEPAATEPAATEPAATEPAAAEAPSAASDAAATLAATQVEVEAATAPASDSQPALPEGDPSAVPAPAPDAAPTPDSGTMPAPQQDILLEPAAPAEAPVVEAAPEAPSAEPAGTQDLPQVPALPQTPAEPEAVPETTQEPQTETAEVMVQPEAENGSSIQPDAALDKEVPGVVTNRLPRIGDNAEAADETETLSLDPQESLPISAYAREFVAEEGKPRFAILLRDIGADGLARADLLKLPFAVTFVIDPAAPDAAEAAAAYRAAGQEVMILADALPEGATAADLEQSFQALAAELPETVAILDAAKGGLQENRPLATQAIPILKSQGRGIVTYDVGLGAAQQVAAREGLAHAAIFRALDAEGEDTPLIRRYLDRAAFKAAQEGTVVVIGRTRPETIAAMLEWMVEGRGSSVQLAPITAVMETE